MMKVYGGFLSSAKCNGRRLSRHAFNRSMGARDGVQKAPGIGVLWVAHDLFCRALFHDLAEIENIDAIGDLVHHREAMGDEEIGETEFRLQALEEIQDLAPESATIRHRHWWKAHEAGSRSARLAVPGENTWDAATDVQPKLISLDLAAQGPGNAVPAIFVCSDNYLIDLLRLYEGVDRKRLIDWTAF